MLFKMKKFYLFAAAAALLSLVSCNKEQGPVSGIESGKPVEVIVSVNGGSSTKAIDVTYADESKVNSLQVLVFNGENLEAYKSVSGQMTAVVPAESGEKTVYAVVNAPNLSGVSSRADFLARATSLADNARDSFVMIGSTTQELVDGGNVPVTVKRIVSRVSIAKISTDFKEYRANYSVKINGIYLINVAGDNNFELSAAPSAWLNKLGHVDTSMDALLYDQLTGVTVSNGNPYVKEHVFYPYPNALPESGTTPAYADTWDPRGTLLVIDATLIEDDGITEHNGYYPIVLPAIERNKTYSIEEVCITRMPGDVPYKPIETGETQVTISVHDWELGLNLGTVTI